MSHVADFAAGAVCAALFCLALVYRVYRRSK